MMAAVKNQGIYSLEPWRERKGENGVAGQEQRSLGGGEPTNLQVKWCRASWAWRKNVVEECNSILRTETGRTELRQKWSFAKKQVLIGWEVIWQCWSKWEPRWDAELGGQDQSQNHWMQGQDKMGSGGSLEGHTKDAVSRIYTPWFANFQMGKLLSS